MSVIRSSLHNDQSILLEMKRMHSCPLPDSSNNSSPIFSCTFVSSSHLHPTPYLAPFAHLCHLGIDLILYVRASQLARRSSPCNVLIFLRVQIILIQFRNVISNIVIVFAYLVKEDETEDRLPSQLPKACRETKYA